MFCLQRVCSGNITAALPIFGQHSGATKRMDREHGLCLRCPAVATDCLQSCYSIEEHVLMFSPQFHTNCCFFSTGGMSNCWVSHTRLEVSERELSVIWMNSI